ncbi:MAG: hypothetical protein QXI59_05735 [Candidatus Bathyarchaeia archaeon]
MYPGITLAGTLGDIRFDLAVGSVLGVFLSWIEIEGLVAAAFATILF